MAKTAERRQMTVMFVDLVGSTDMLQHCDQEEFFEFLVNYQTHVRECVARFDGYVARLVGDGVLVYFGWPVAHEDGAVRAIRTGNAIVSGISKLLNPEGKPAACRIGIATGVVVVGKIATQSNQHQDEIFGKVPHLADRLQSTGEPNSITVCQETRALAKGQFYFEKIPTPHLKGFVGKSLIYRAGAEKSDVSRFAANSGDHRLQTFGRDKELDFITGLWPKATQQQGQIVWIRGESGVGKSHLIEAARRRIVDNNLLTIRYHCSRSNSQSPLYPFIRRTEIWADIKPHDPPEVRRQKFLNRLESKPKPELLTVISNLMGFPQVSMEYPFGKLQAKKSVMNEACMHLLGMAIKSHSALILIEDLHWADPSTLDLMNYVSANIDKLGALMLVTYRDEIDAPNLTHENFHKISLGPLIPRDTKKMVIDIAGGHKPDDDILATIVKKTDGIPLYVDAYTRMFMDHKKSGTDEIAFQGMTDVPFSLHDILMERFDQQGDSKTIAQICSAIGQEFTVDLVARIANRPRSQIVAALSQLSEAKILICIQGSGEDLYRFRHSLIQDAAYQGLLKRSRRQIHLSIARVLEHQRQDIVDSEPGFVAEHFRVAEKYPEALKYLLIAARKSITKFANREAIDHCNQAIVLLRKLDDQAEKNRLELEFQTISANARRSLYGFASKGTITAFERMLELASKLQNSRQYSRAIRGLFNALHAEGQYQKALDMADRMIEGADDDVGRRMIAHNMRAIPLIWQGKFQKAKEELELSLKCFDEMLTVSAGDDINKPVQILSSMAIALAFLGDSKEASETSRRAVRQAIDHGNPLEIANCYLSACNSLRIIRHDDALDMAQKFLQFATDMKMPYYSSAATAFVGLAMFERGQKEQGLERLEAGWEDFTRTESRINQVFYMAETAECNLLAGNLQEAHTAVNDGFALMETYGERNFEAELHRINGEIMLANGSNDKEIIAGEFQKAIDIANRQSARIFEQRARKSLENFLKQ